jgi:hypothetical protein
MMFILQKEFCYPYYLSSQSVVFCFLVNVPSEEFFILGVAVLRTVILKASVVLSPFRAS